MNEDDLTQEILFGTPDMTAQEEQQLMLQAEQSAQDMSIMESMARRQALQQEMGTPQQPQRSQQQPAQPTGQGQQKQEGGQNILKQAFDVLAAPGQGINDWFVDTINLIPGVELKKAPKFQADVTQGLREVSSVVLPTIFLTKGIGSGLQTAATASRAKLFNDPFLKFVAPKLLGAGVGAGVDYAVEFNQTDDNLSGTLKKAFPAQFGWIPDNVATLDSDSPDIKRAKNVTEGVKDL